MIDLKIDNFDLAKTGFETDEIAGSVFGSFGGRGTSVNKGKKAQVEIVEAYEVVVSCIDEEQQAKLLERLKGEGFEVRALISAGA